MKPSPRLVLAEPDGPETTVLTLNRPDKRNALCIALLEELVAAVAAAAKNPAQRILIVRGAGPAFCAGLDLAEASDATRGRRSAELVARSLLALSASRLVTIAVVHGAAVAGGAGLVSACDMAVAAVDARIGYPETRRGLVAGLVMTLLRRQIRERDAREILLTGELFSAERAHEIGLVNRVAPTAEAAFAEARRLADAVLRGGPGAVSRTKALLGGLWHRPLRADLDRALRAHLEARNSAEAAEGIAAYLEKRPPKWAPGPAPQRLA
ncbi:MAG TPA: enoyl-CoA hydratase/isomerase family protein [Opitutaceae bacterium]|nr:enoyl-CoA hydratase/isomerase family protein [Opitutaceae bacterium]